MTAPAVNHAWKLYVSFLLGIIAVTLALSGCGSTPVAAATDPQPLIEALLETEQTAWNSNNSAAYASAFTDDADFINIRGQVFTGRAAIQGVHAVIFAGPFKGSTIAITLRLFKLLSPGVALVDTDQQVTRFAFLPPGIVPTSPGTLLTHFKYIAAEQSDGTWKLSAGQNTAALPNPPSPGNDGAPELHGAPLPRPSLFEGTRFDPQPTEPL